MLLQHQQQKQYRIDRALNFNHSPKCEFTITSYGVGGFIGYFN